jgi:hypothetical protein
MLFGYFRNEGPHVDSCGLAEDFCAHGTSASEKSIQTLD